MIYFCSCVCQVPCRQFKEAAVFEHIACWTPMRVHASQVSYGPTILGAHSPDERLDVSTVAPFWQATLALMQSLAAVRP